MRPHALALLLPAFALTAQAPGARLQKGESFMLVNGTHTISFGAGEEGQSGRYVGDGLWFRKGGKAYLVTDAAIVTEAKKAAEPVNKLGAAQGRLGAEQGRLGGRQGQLGAEQGHLGIRMAGASAAEREELSAQMKSMAQRQKGLGREQEALGAQQRELGRQQEAASEAAILKLRALREEALAKGWAKPL